ncbi:DUF4817 domain-containing protein [Trichonephila clavipes]|nr:DUF4817 domain-containing protein [Trichonephila clavipes]
MFRKVEGRPTRSSSIDSRSSLKRRWHSQTFELTMVDSPAVQEKPSFLSHEAKPTNFGRSQLRVRFGHVKAQWLSGSVITLPRYWSGVQIPGWELWFQQDGATCHTARATIDLLKDTFGDHLISRFGPVNWPPRSCDLTPLDYFLGGYVKSLVYADKPQTLDHLEDNIRRVIADIRPQMLEKVIENWTSRLDYIRASRGSPLPEII